MSGSIKAIETDAVHRIHSGHVVLDLQGAIKELVENSLDAGATNIDVRIKDNGLDSVEISDNGSGIAEADWESIGLKHHTSKLPSLADLYKVTTFGFRGEALSALCALCESVTVITSTKETAPMGSIIKLGRDGTVVNSSGKVARPRGTTITLTGLFVPLPVRRKEFERTVKRELTKALTLLTAYALVPASVSSVEGRPGVRLKVETIGAGRTGKRSTQLSTDGRGSLRSSVGAVWGHKALDGVQDINLELDVEIDRVMARREGISEGTQRVKVVGLISSAQWGQGRASADRQFYYINGRPCNITTVARAVNEVYKSFNTNQVPLTILDFQIPPESVDINVSPDKRTIFVHSEDRLIEALKIALDQFFQPSRSTFVVGGATQTVQSMRQIQSQLPSYSASHVDSEAASGPGGKADEGLEEAEAEADELDALPEADLGEEAPKRASPSNEHVAEADAVIEIDTESEEEVPARTPSWTSSRPSRQHSQVSRPSRIPSPPPTTAISTQRRIQQTLDTSTASWSPDKKSKSTASSLSSSTGSRARAGPGPSSREARANLRKRLEGYASQSGGIMRNDEPDSDNEEREAEEEGAVTVADDLAVERAKAGSSSAGISTKDPGVEEEEISIDQLAEEDSDKEEEDDPASLFEHAASAADEAQSINRRRPPDEPIFVDEGETTPVDGGEILTEQEDEDVPMAVDSGVNDEPARPSPRRKTSSYRDEISSTAVQGEMTLKFDLPRLRSRYAARRKQRLDLETEKQNKKKVRDAFDAVKEAGLAVAAGIANKDAALAEEALSRVISKEDFARMEVLGQFNRGFIIARLKSETHHPGEDVTRTKGRASGTDDLFIIDQHACDEKYNFETLQRTTVIKGQSLIKPRPLQLTAGDEIVAMENLDILHRNGFDVKVDEEALPGRGEKISLLAMPVSKDTTFDFKDLEQLLHMLGDGARPQGQMVRCTKARAMFAMRACRKSVMIGKALTKGQMVNLLRNMGTIDQPWNCPHGRPTMRHLSKIEAPSKSRSRSGRIDWMKWTKQRDSME
ncbi:hypothetical protein IAU59_004531 [Kwoniella sp. CBS 9459]